jgi:superoxide dismutase, Cu-Zn family
MKFTTISLMIISGFAVSNASIAADHSAHHSTPQVMPENGIIVTLNLLSNQGIEKEIGTITLSDSQYGLLLTPQLSDLPQGIHGFHVHENGSCEPLEKDGKMVAGLAAGGHFDPQNTGKHLGPYSEGHLGDLPPLIVAENGEASLQVLAPRLKVADIMGKSLMVHVGGDNYSDEPKPLGGGGPRLACGVIPSHSH